MQTSKAQIVDTDSFYYHLLYTNTILVDSSQIEIPTFKYEDLFYKFEEVNPCHLTQTYFYIDNILASYNPYQVRLTNTIELRDNKSDENEYDIFEVLLSDITGEVLERKFIATSKLNSQKTDFLKDVRNTLLTTKKEEFWIIDSVKFGTEYKNIGECFGSYKLRLFNDGIFEQYYEGDNKLCAESIPLSNSKFNYNLDYHLQGTNGKWEIRNDFIYFFYEGNYKIQRFKFEIGKGELILKRDEILHKLKMFDQKIKLKKSGL